MMRFYSEGRPGIKQQGILAARKLAKLELFNEYVCELSDHTDFMDICGCQIIPQ